MGQNLFKSKRNDEDNNNHAQLTDDEKLVSHSDVNVVQHETLDEIVEHLADAQIIGDIPVEVEF